MASRYQYQFQGGMKPKMVNIEGFVSIGTGGLPNSVVAIASGVGNLTTIAGNSGTYYGLLPGCPTTGVPTGWQGTFSGAIGLYGAGVAGIARLATGLYSVLLSDDYVRLDSVQVIPVGGQIAENNGGTTGFLGGGAQTGIGMNVTIPYHTVGLGNSVTTGSMGSNGISSGLIGQNLKNQILIQFSAGAAVDLPLSSGFFIAIRLADSSAGPQ